MLIALFKYRHLSISILILSYLLSAIQVPILEVTHLLTHAQEIWKGVISHHAYQTHDESHEHIHLALWDGSDKDQSEHEPFLDLSDLNKKNKYLQHHAFLLEEGLPLSRIVFNDVFRYKSHYQEVDLPPPRNVYC